MFDNFKKFISDRFLLYDFYPISKKNISEVMNEFDLEKIFEALKILVINVLNSGDDELILDAKDLLKIFINFDLSPKCDVCYEKISDPEELVVSKGGHFICKDCLRNVYSNFTSNLNLDYLDSFEDESNCFGEERFSSLGLNTDIIREVKRSCYLLDLDIDFFNCPYCSSEIMIKKNSISSDIVCSNPECRKEICVKCKRASHKPMSCEEAECFYGISNIETVFFRSIDENILVKCPNCYVTIDKVENCNKVGCTRCGAYFCYHCGQDLSQDEGYEHFRNLMNPVGDDGKCPIYYIEKDKEVYSEKHHQEYAYKRAVTKALKDIENLILLRIKKDLPINYKGEMLRIYEDVPRILEELRTNALERI